MTVCYAVREKLSGERKKKRFRKLQSDIQTIADEEFMTIYRIAYAKWIIEKIDDKTSGKKFKVRMHLLSDVFTMFQIFTTNSKLLMFFRSTTMSFLSCLWNFVSNSRE